MSEQENYTSVWVWAANVAEVSNQQGFVECTESIAKKLIEDGLAQDPAVGGFDLIELEDPTSSKPKRGRPAKVEKVLTPDPAPAPVQEKAQDPKPEPTPAPAPVIEQPKQVAPAPTASKATYNTK